MKTGQKVTITNQFHPYRGQSGKITNIELDEFGEIVFIQLVDGKNIMVEKTDITLNTKGK